LGKHYFLHVLSKEEKTAEGFQKYWVYFAIKFTAAKITEIAHMRKIYGDLDVSNIRYPFNKHMSRAFRVFDAR
jgi:hypothetical protein